MGLIQTYEWGHIQWLTDQNRSTAEAVDIGIVTIFPQYAQQRHIHYGDEQWLYVLSGSGVSVVDQVESPVVSGSSIHIPAGAAHETRNPGAVPLIEIMISYPKQFDDIWAQQQNPFKSTRDLVDVSRQLLTISDEDEIRIRTFAETLALPITVYDTQGQILLSIDNFPKPCRNLCGIHEKISNCHIYGQDLFFKSPAFSEQSAHYCQYGLAVIDTPIVFDNQMIGNVRGGHILTEDDYNHIHPALQAETMNHANIPKGRLRIILNQYKNLAGHLADSYEKQISAQRDDATRTDDSIRALREDLDLALGRILNLQINNHFLFNTLNALAGLSLEEDAFRTYRSIIDLSKLFRYNLRTGKEFVTLQDEFQYIRNYSALQEIRFGDRLKVEIIAPEEALKFCLPFNTLQPLVENAFLHGFRNSDVDMRIALEATEKAEEVVVTIRDNGAGIDAHQMNELLNRLNAHASPSRGIGMVIERLRLLFGSGFRFSIDSEPGRGFRITLILPKKTLTDELLRGLL